MRNRSGSNGDQSGKGSRSRSSIVPSCTLAPGRANTSSSFHSNCSASPLTTVTFRWLNSGQNRGQRANHQHAGRRPPLQQAGHHLPLQVQRQERRIEDIQIGVRGQAVFGIFHAMTQAGENGRQIGEQQCRRPIVAVVEVADHAAAKRAVAHVLPDAETTSKILGNVQFSRIPENNVHK